METSSDTLDVFDLQSDEFKFLDYPNTFLTTDSSNGDDGGSLNKSANTQLDENFKELIKVTNSERQPSAIGASNRNHRVLNGCRTTISYLDELNDLKELKRIEDKKLQEQSLNRLSRLNLVTNTQIESVSKSNHSPHSINTNQTYSSGPLSNRLNLIENGHRTFKFEQKSFRPFKSNSHLATDEHENAKPTTDLDSTFNLRNSNEENERTFVLDDKEFSNFTGQAVEEAQYDGNNTFLVAQNYDDVQQIARQQEEALKKHQQTKANLFLPTTSPSFNNATITKARKNCLYSNKLDQTITLRHMINENLINDKIKSPNLDGTFNLGNPMDCQPSQINETVANTIKKEKVLPNSRSFILSQKNTNNLKRLLVNSNNNNNNNNINNNSNKTMHLEAKNNRLNSSFIVGEIQDLKPNLVTSNADLQTANQKDFKSMNLNQFSTITKNKITANLKRTNTFKVREFQYASEENLTSNLTFSKNGNANFAITAKSGLNVNIYPSIDDMKNYDTIKINQRQVNKLNSKSNGSIHSNVYNNEKGTNDEQFIHYKIDSKLPAFTSRLKAPSRLSVMKGNDEF